MNPLYIFPIVAFAASIFVVVVVWTDNTMTRKRYPRTTSIMSNGDLAAVAICTTVAF